MKAVLDMADKDMYRVKLERQAAHPESTDSLMIEARNEPVAPTGKKGEVH